jgi:uncharacterized protein YbjQ (UPF0145 family)
MRSESKLVIMYAYHREEKIARRNALAKLQKVANRHWSPIIDLDVNAREMRNGEYEGVAQGTIIVWTTGRPKRRGRFGR